MKSQIVIDGDYIPLIQTLSILDETASIWDIASSGVEDLSRSIIHRQPNTDSSHWRTFSNPNLSSIHQFCTSSHPSELGE